MQHREKVPRHPRRHRKVRQKASAMSMQPVRMHAATAIFASAPSRPRHRSPPPPWERWSAPTQCAFIDKTRSAVPNSQQQRHRSQLRGFILQHNVYLIFERGVEAESSSERRDGGVIPRRVGRADDGSGAWDETRGELLPARGSCPAHTVADRTEAGLPQGRQFARCPVRVPLEPAPAARRCAARVTYFRRRCPPKIC